MVGGDTDAEPDAERAELWLKRISIKSLRKRAAF
jgi:hypothetical protein